MQGAAYSVSKAALIHLTKTLVGELSPHIPHGDIGELEDLDGLILYLASNKASSYVQGANFTIDGGMSWGGKYF